MTQTPQHPPMTYEQLQQSHDEWRMLAMHNYGVAKAAEEREQCLKESWEQLREIVSANAIGGKGEDINDYDIMINMMDDLLYLASLYPDTPAPKEEDNQ